MIHLSSLERLRNLKRTIRSQQCHQTPKVLTGANRILDASLTSLHLPAASQVSLIKISSLEAQVLR